MDKRITFGNHSYGDIHIEGRSNGKVIIGNYTSLGRNITAFMSYDHKLDNISTYPFGHPSLEISQLMPSVYTKSHFYQANTLKLQIGNDVWIGDNAVLFNNITIGDGAVIGAYSIITKDIPPYTVAVGHSRFLRKRFSDDDIDFLLKLKWWDKPDKEVVDLVPLLSSADIGALRKKYD
jgi:acetyltransferase-like isoleucine patch superfamily enzyme